MTASPPEPNGDDDLPEIPDFIPEEGFLAAGPKEASAEERAAQAARIARGNDRLRAAGQIADGTGGRRPDRRRHRQARLPPSLQGGAVDRDRCRGRGTHRGRGPTRRLAIPPSD